MARYSDEIIEDIRQANDIVDVISRIYAIKKKWQKLFWLMPISQ